MEQLTDLSELVGAWSSRKRIIRELAERAKPVGVEFGVAYGGSIQKIGRMWQECGGVVYGFDTFTGHPRYLGWSATAAETVTMNQWYEQFGLDKTSAEYIQGALDREGLTNVVLRPGLLNEHSLDGIPHLDYAFLDLDFVASMVLAWTLVRGRMRSGGYLCLHDCTPRDHMPGLWGLYQEIVASGGYDVVEDCPKTELVVLRRK